MVMAGTAGIGMAAAHWRGGHAWRGGSRGWHGYRGYRGYGYRGWRGYGWGWGGWWGPGVAISIGGYGRRCSVPELRLLSLPLPLLATPAATAGAIRKVLLWPET